MAAPVVARARRRRAKSTSPSISIAMSRRPRRPTSCEARAIRPKPRWCFANDATREVNRLQQENIQHRHHLGRGAAAAHGPHRHRHPGDLDRAGPVLLLGRARARPPDRAPHQREHRPHLRRPSRPLRRLGHRAAPGAGIRRRRARARGEGARPARRRDLHQRQRRGIVGAERFRPFFAKARGARHPHLHASLGLHPRAAPQRPLLHQRHRQSARFDGGGASPDLRRRARGLSAASRSWWRMAAAICRPIPAASTTPTAPAPTAAASSRRSRRAI